MEFFIESQNSTPRITLIFKSSSFFSSIFFYTFDLYQHLQKKNITIYILKLIKCRQTRLIPVVNILYYQKAFYINILFLSLKSPIFAKLTVFQLFYLWKVSDTGGTLQEFYPNYNDSFHFTSLVTCVKQLRKAVVCGTTNMLIIFKFLFHQTEELCLICFLSGKVMDENKLTEARSIPDGSTRYE